MQRILVIGSPGTGKTTFARQLADKTGLPLIHLDLYYHDKTKDYYNEINKEAWAEKVNKLIHQDSWIIDGNYNSTLTQRVARADTIMFFDLPRRTAFSGVFKRRMKYHHRKRNDMPSDWEEHMNAQFLKYIWKFNKDKRPKIKQTIFEPKDKTVVVFKNHKEATSYLETL